MYCAFLNIRRTKIHKNLVSLHKMCTHCNIHIFSSVQEFTKLDHMCCNEVSTNLKNKTHKELNHLEYVF